MDFIGKICPYCKTEFQPEDEVVVCSVCEMPHHKECWIENKACTTFGCTGTIVGADQYTQAVENKSFCTKCGAPLNEGQKFCSSCGTPAGATGEPHFRPAGTPAANQTYQQPVYTPPQPVTPPYQAPQPQYTAPQPNPVYQQNTGYQQYNGYQQNTGYQQNAGGYQQPHQPVDPDLYAFIKTNQASYIPKFQKMQTTNSNTSWNWCSFLFGASWFAYRKMYGIAAVVYVISLVSLLIPGLGSIIQLALWICSGLFGNHFYKQYVDGELRIAKGMDTYNKTAYMEKKGGTSVAAVCILLGVGFILSLIISNL